ncbi:RNA polymerase sigma factor ShbA [Saccharomonospora cyanea]|uniref:RNA polymerase sigma factor, sigma-70 family n=1 Tax=Saccharomonospora cyanea NA-134 TaxID=882082 RepID=H5XF28_9PSEU|nr:RNA polymerase sigma factor ShbA [Saccharomonospora cyanea]EHR60424.1 RNA polymerase sigma factor, sigma-70 family [Saccharomonospora cyanea NA-134]
MDSAASGGPPLPDPALTAAQIDPVVHDAVEGDALAVHTLTRMIAPVVTQYCRARLGRRDFGYICADDVAQDICVAVLQALPHYHDRGGSFLFVVRAIASNKVADAFRLLARERSRPTPDLPERSDDGRDDPEPRSINAELGRELGRLLRRLPSRQRDILVLRVVVGLSARETGEALGLSPANVRTSQHRALSRLRTLAAAAPL